MDVKSAFLNGVLEEEVYFEQPLRYNVKEEEDKFLKLKQTLYGLKQATQAMRLYQVKKLTWKDKSNLRGVLDNINLIQPIN